MKRGVKPAVSQEQIFEAANKLVANGEKATIRAVQAELGAGSKDYIGTVLKAWKLLTGAPETNYITRERVFAAADKIAGGGAQVGTRSVARELSSESFKTIREYLNEWEELNK